MTLLDTIRNKIRMLYTTHPDIHVNISLKNPQKIVMHDLPVTITGVYPHMFQVEYCSGGISRQYTHQYTDLVTGNVEIREIPELAGMIAALTPIPRHRR